MPSTRGFKEDYPYGVLSGAREGNVFLPAQERKEEMGIVWERCM